MGSLLLVVILVGACAAERVAAAAGPTPLNGIEGVHRGRWPSGVVPYTIGRRLVGTPVEQAILAAMADIESKTCIAFSPRGGEPEYVRFVAEPRQKHCHLDALGFAPNHVRTLNLAPACRDYNATTQAAAAHKLLHTLGLNHEHTRRARNAAIQLHPDHIHPHHLPLFSRSFSDPYGTPYDYSSIMHYPPTHHFTTLSSHPTFHPLHAPPAPPHPAIGAAAALSAGDALRLRRRYQCPGRGTPGALSVRVGAGVALAAFDGDADTHPYVNVTAVDRHGRAVVRTTRAFEGVAARLAWEEELRFGRRSWQYYTVAVLDETEEPQEFAAPLTLQETFGVEKGKRVVVHCRLRGQEDCRYGRLRLEQTLEER